MHIHSVRETGRKRRERGGKYRKNKGNGKYSKAHAWVLTKCKWKRKAPHQHIAIKGSSQITCKLFSKTVFLLFSLPLPLLFLPALPLFHPFVCLLISYTLSHIPWPCFCSSLQMLEELKSSELPQGGNSASLRPTWSRQKRCYFLCERAVEVLRTSPEWKQLILQDVFSIGPLIHQVQLGDHTDGP